MGILWTRRKKRVLAFVLTLLIGTGVTYATINITLIAPSVTIPSSPQLVTACCIFVDGPPNPTPGFGIIRFYCSPTSGAFSVNSAGAATVGFALPKGYTSLNMTVHSDACNLFGFTIQIVSGNRYTLTPGDYD